jgi:hypothetical protein
MNILFNYNNLCEYNVLERLIQEAIVGVPSSR